MCCLLRLEKFTLRFLTRNLFLRLLILLVFQRILHAIQQADPFYNHLKWAEEAQQNEVYMRNICQMPCTLRNGHESIGEDIDDGMYADEEPR